MIQNENKQPFDASAFFVLLCCTYLCFTVLLLSHKAPGYTNLLGNLNPRVLKRESKNRSSRVSESILTRDWEKTNSLNPKSIKQNQDPKP